MAVPSTAHAGVQIVLFEKHLPLAAGELAALVRMDHHPGLGFAPPDGREQGLQRQVGRHARLGGPTDPAAREQIDGDRQLQPPVIGLDAGVAARPLFLNQWRTRSRPRPCRAHRLRTASPRSWTQRQKASRHIVQGGACSRPAPGCLQGWPAGTPGSRKPGRRQKTGLHCHPIRRAAVLSPATG